MCTTNNYTKNCFNELNSANMQLQDEKKKIKLCHKNNYYAIPPIRVTKPRDNIMKENLNHN